MTYNQPPDLPTILAAVCGDADATTSVLEHYSGYINTLAANDVEERCQLESKLLEALLKFRV